MAARTSSAGPADRGDEAMLASVGAALHGMSLEDKVGQLFVTYLHGKSADEVNADNQKDFGVATAADVVRRYHPGGVIYFHNASRDNIADPAQVAALSNGLQRAATSSGVRLPLTIATDQEQGIVTRIGPPATQFPGSMALGAGRSAADAKQAAAITGRELRAMGINQDFAPDSDVNSNPQNPVIGVRSFAGDPALAGQLVAAQVDGYQRSSWPTATVSATAKHFPGHGDAGTDSHTSLPIVDHTIDQWRQIEKPPFVAAIRAGIDSIMTAHIEFPKIDPSGEPATLSPTILTGLLRHELGYDGVVITDSLEMAGVRQLHSDAEIPVLALKAGADQLLMPPNLGLAIDSVVAAVRSGVLTEQRIDQSVFRVLRMKFLRGILVKPLVDEKAVGSVVGTADNLAAAQRITDRTVTAVRNDAVLLPVRGKPGHVLVTGWGVTTTATLSGRIAARGPAVQTMATGYGPSDDQIGQAVTAAGGADLVVALTNGLPDDPQQQALLTRLLATGKPVVAVAVRNPYDTGYVDAAQTWLATYSYSAVSMESLTRVLFGEISPKGKLPVNVPAGGDAKTVRYPFGLGLSW
ncbi:glycoside hydrolase family 3 protein [Solihabitans fulvus]|uniref:beta-N-acetylhexosaminidase n=1 Tax=Solihabitans fulvus TaxID=1892852 RepID=A0A5B2XHF1_9PSEU|nr:glycoside hydrolase family 3 protein [Solihabitans fulvus]KAA2262465.1 glycoside hydrolase family 3 protein [Solihabitans fulvus]